MKNIILCSLLVAMCLVSQTFATCNYEGNIVEVGEKISAPDCVQLTCNSNGAFFGITCPEARCPEHLTEHHTPMDPSKPYPDCCPKLTCE